MKAKAPSTLRWRNLKTAYQITRRFAGYAFDKNSGRLEGNRLITVMTSISVKKKCLSRLKRKSGVFKFLRFEECFRKVLFS